MSKNEINTLTILVMNLSHTLQRIPKPFWLLLAAGLYALLHVLGAVQVIVDGLPGRQVVSKLYHIVFYAGLAALLWSAMRRPSATLAVFLTMCAGAADEIHQSFSPFRHAQVSDVLIDTLAATAAVAYLAWRARQVARDAAGEGAALRS